MPIPEFPDGITPFPSPSHLVLCCEAIPFQTRLNSATEFRNWVGDGIGRNSYQFRNSVESEIGRNWAEFPEIPRNSYRFRLGHNSVTELHPHPSPSRIVLCCKVISFQTRLNSATEFWNRWNWFHGRNWFPNVQHRGIGWLLDVS